jgi:hypothetical protein
MEPGALDLDPATEPQSKFLFAMADRQVADRAGRHALLVAQWAVSSQGPDCAASS